MLSQRQEILTNFNQKRQSCPDELKETNPEKFEQVTQRLKERRQERLEYLKENNPERFQEIMDNRKAHLQERLEDLKTNNPERYEQLMRKRQEWREKIPAGLPPELEQLASLEGVRKFPLRVKCATLGWNTVMQGFEAAKS